MKTPYNNSEDLNEAKENHRSIPDNNPSICSPIRERDSEDPLEQTPTGGNINLNYVTPTATDKNNRRLNIIGNNAPSQNHHESRLSGISPSAKGYNESSMIIHNSIASDVYSKPAGFGVTDQTIKPFKITTPSGVGNQSNSKSSMGSKISKLKEEISDTTNLMWLLRKIGVAYLAQIQFSLTNAIELYKKLPENQFKTGWVLTQVGICYSDIQDFAEGEKVFSLMRKLEPYTIEGLQHYSICLWHLKKLVELCALSNFVLKKNSLAPETWIVVGNCYSIQNKNEAAIKFFKRAIQLDRNCGMAYTLCGHEYFEIEDFEQSELHYKKGYSVDKRNYKAWWGVGNIYMKQEKYDKALKNFNVASSIFRDSSFLHTYIGMALLSSKQEMEALKQFEKSHEINPKTPLNSYMRVQALIKLNENDKALELLTELIKRHPKESRLHVDKGTLMKNMGFKEEALKDFNRALDLNPKDSNMIKDLIDN